MTTTSALTRTRDHCRAMARTEPHVTLWAQLADEITAWLDNGLDQVPGPAAPPEEVLW